MDLILHGFSEIPFPAKHFIPIQIPIKSVMGQVLQHVIDRASLRKHAYFMGRYSSENLNSVTPFVTSGTDFRLNV
jgi:hypothetical protein